MDKERYKKARLLAGKLNKLRHRQAKKIDILCNDMVSAHGDFVKQLRSLIFNVNFYESLLAQSDLMGLLNTAGELIKDSVSNSNVSVFLVSGEGFELHLIGQGRPIEICAGKVETYFTDEVVYNISRANHLCRLNDMFEMGLQGNPAELGKICAAAVPLSRFGPPVGFILIYRSAENELTGEELERVMSVTPGLCGAIKSQQKFARTAETN